VEKLTEANNNLKAFESVEDVAKELIKSAKEISTIDPCKLSDEYVAELTKKATELAELYEENDATIKQLTPFFKNEPTFVPQIWEYGKFSVNNNATLYIFDYPTLIADFDLF